MATITIPSFDFSGFYYAQILESLLQFKRINLPEFTDESPQDPLIQMLRAFALVGHLNSVDVDIVANESTLRTARLPESIRDMLALIGYNLASASPAQADIVFRLTAPLSAYSEVVPSESRVATKETVDLPSIVFEIPNGIYADRSDRGYISRIYAYNPSGSVYSDLTTDINSETPVTPWATPAVGMMLYIGHSGVMWDSMTFVLGAVSSGIFGVWERYDGTFLNEKPVSKTRVGATLVFNVNSLLGASNRAGAIVRVQLDSSGAYENCASTWSGTENEITTSSLLGLSVAESDVTTESAYTIGNPWKELDITNDELLNFTANGDLDYNLPENVAARWDITSVNGEECYWIRYRIVSLSTPTVPAPVIDSLRIDRGSQYVKGVAIQGTTQIDANLGTGDGSTPDLEFTTTKDGYIDGSIEVEVDGSEWVEVDNFLQSVGIDKHYVVRIGANDRATIVFGNGSNGVIPSGVVSATYRYGIDSDGNVGALSIIADKSGLSYVNNLFNPRPSIGWQESQSATTASLELAKQLGPASLRTLGGVALSPSDVESMTIAYRDPNTNIRPLIRAKAVEEGLGPKTVKIIVVAAGGGAASIEQLDAVAKYFNGDRTVSPTLPKRIVCNQEVGVENYSPKIINIAATVKGSESTAAVEDVLTALIQPGTTMDDGVSFEWNFGGSVFLSRIYYEIHKADPSIYQVVSLTINGSTADLALLDNELPIAGAISITEV